MTKPKIAVLFYSTDSTNHKIAVEAAGAASQRQRRNRSSTGKRPGNPRLFRDQ